MSETFAGDNALGTYLRDRRARLNPADFGFSGRRRTPGLRREEVAQRANLSVTWYTWLEQGRGGVPSASVLERLARALALTSAEREHLFLLAQHRPPEVRRQAEAVTPHLQRVLSALEPSPAFVKTPTWDVLAWNRAAAAVLTDYGALEPEERNILRLVFGLRARASGWESNARFVVATFRLEVARARLGADAGLLVEELSRSSPEFSAMWRENEVGSHGEGTKRLDHPEAGALALEYSTFAVDGQPGLSLVVFNPVTPADAERVRSLVKSYTLASTRTPASTPN